MEVDGVDWQKLEDRQMQVEGHVKLEQAEAERKARDCRDQVRGDPKNDAYCDKIIGRMAEFVTIWDAHSGPTSVNNTALN